MCPGQVCAFYFCFAILRHLTQKSRKTALLNFSNLVQLRRSLAARIKSRIKEGDVLQQTMNMVCKLKEAARRDLVQSEDALNQAHKQQLQKQGSQDGSSAGGSFFGRRGSRGSPANADDASTVLPGVDDDDNEDDDDDDDAAPLRLPGFRAAGTLENGGSSDDEEPETSVKADSKARSRSFAALQDDDDLFKSRKFQKRLDAAVDKEVVDKQATEALDTTAEVPSDELKEMLSDVVVDTHITREAASCMQEIYAWLACDAA